jgi:hypothetical protein
MAILYAYNWEDMDRMLCLRLQLFSLLSANNMLEATSHTEEGNLKKSPANKIFGKVILELIAR